MIDDTKKAEFNEFITEMTDYISAQSNRLQKVPIRMMSEVHAGVDGVETGRSFVFAVGDTRRAVEDITDDVKAVLKAAECSRCDTKNDRFEHSPACLLLHRIVTGSVEHSMVVILNPHSSVGKLIPSESSEQNTERSIIKGENSIADIDSFLSIIRRELVDAATDELPIVVDQTTSFSESNDGLVVAGHTFIINVSQESPEPAAFKSRVILEAENLNRKLQKLTAFLQTNTFRGLPAAERDRLARQRNAMYTYSLVLQERLYAEFGIGSGQHERELAAIKKNPTHVAGGVNRLDISGPNPTAIIDTFTRNLAGSLAEAAAAGQPITIEQKNTYDKTIPDEMLVAGSKVTISIGFNE